MKMKNMILLIWLALGLCACASSVKPKAKSEFLKNYTHFKPSPRAKETWISTNSQFDYAQFIAYQRIAFAPIEIWPSKSQQLTIHDIEKQEAITQYFEDAIKKRLKGNKQIVRPGTQGALLVKMAITYIDERSPELEALDILPFRIVMNGGELAYLAATDQKVVVGKATVEVEFVDVDSNQGIAAAIISNTTGEMHVKNSDNNIETAKAILDNWAERLYNAVNGIAP